MALAAIALAGSLVACTVPPTPPPRSAAPEASAPDDLRPVVLVHGADGSAAQFQTQALRLASNGYPSDLVAAYEYDSTFSTATLADVHTGLDELVASLRERTGADQVDLVAEGLGTFVAQTWLHSAAPRAQGVAHYVNIDGGAGGRAPDGVATLAVWGRGRPTRAITGATNVHLDLRRADLVGSSRTFAELFRFLTGVAPATRQVVPERPGTRITLSGRAVVRPFNLGMGDAGGTATTLDVYRIGHRSGQEVGTEPDPDDPTRRRAELVTSVPLGERGAWGPVEVDAGRRYELVVRGADGVELARSRHGPALRSDHLVRIVTVQPPPGLGEVMVDAVAANAGYVSVPGASAVPSPDRQPHPFDCDGPVPDADPGTAEWYRRDANNLFCTQQRHLDKMSHPVVGLPTGAPAADAYRDPAGHDGVRFRVDAVTIAGLRAEVYRPCAAGTCSGLPEGLDTFEPPYPAVITLHGGGSNKELHWWSSQALAEAGYLTIAFDGANLANARAVLDWLHAGTDPLAAEFDGAHVGVAGHSIGGDAAATLAHGDPRVSAAVYWDRAGLSSPPAGGLRVPSLAMMGDYGCTAPLVCPLEPRAALPDPAARGAKAQDFPRLQEAGVDTMQVALRGATHFDWVPDTLSGNRYAELVNTYYMVAWFDRYLRGADDAELAADAHARLTATVFDDSADRHNISQGRYDPARAAASGDPYGGNVPYRIAGMPVADRLSFYYPSRCFLSLPSAPETPGPPERAVSDDLRHTPCAAAAPGP